MGMKAKFLSKMAVVGAGTVMMCALSACGTTMTSDTITVDADGNYAYATIDDSDYYVVRFFKEEDIKEDGTIKEDARPALKQTLQAAAGTTGNFKKVSKLAFGKYVATIYGLNMDKSTTDVVIGDELIIGGTLTAPEIVVQNDYGNAKVSVTDKSFDSYYFNSEALYSFTAEVYDNADCSGTPVQTVTFGEDAEYTEPTNSSKAIWIVNRSVEIPLDDGTWYVRCKADGNADDEIESSAYSDTVEVAVNSAATDVKYCEISFDPATGQAVSVGDNILEFGNGASMFTEFEITDDADTVEDGDLYTLNGAANCDLHLVGNEGDTSGEAYSCGPRLMPVDKPETKGTWKQNEDGTITVTLMNDYQYYIDEADKKTT